MNQTLASWHPFLVHFAVAFTLSSAALDIVDFFTRKEAFERTTFTLAILALPFLLSAVLTGNLASHFIEEPGKRLILSQHETYANIAVWLFCATTLWRVFLRVKREFTGVRKILYVFLVTAAAMSVFLAAMKGGSIRHQPYGRPQAEDVQQTVVNRFDARDNRTVKSSTAAYASSTLQWYL